MINIWSLLFQFQCLETLFLTGHFKKSSNTKDTAVSMKFPLEVHFHISTIAIKTYEWFLNSMNF